MHGLLAPLAMLVNRFSELEDVRLLPPFSTLVCRITRLWNILAQDLGFTSVQPNDFQAQKQAGFEFDRCKQLPYLAQHLPLMAEAKESGLFRLQYAFNV